MKIILLIEETSFYHPQFTYNLIKKLENNHKIVFGGVIHNKSNNSSDNYLKKNIFKFKFIELFKLFFKKKKNEILSLFFTSGFKNNFFSVRSVFKKKKINFIDIKDNINDTKYLQSFKKYKPDLIISSNPQYFKEELIKLPKYGCINRHFSLLPKYKGLWPVFYSISNCDQSCGITIHKINEKYDEGKILAQKKIEITEKNISRIYLKLFNLTPNIISEAIDNLNNDKSVESDYESSYNSFPTAKDWELFRKNNGVFI